MWAQKRLRSARRFPCQGAVIPRPSSACCPRQNASPSSDRYGCTPRAGYGQSRKRQPSMQLVPGADDILPAVRLASSESRSWLRQGGRPSRAALGQVQQDEYIADELPGWGYRPDTAPRRLNPQVMLAVALPRRRPGTDAGDDAALVDPQESLGMSGPQGLDRQLARLVNKRMIFVPGDYEPAPHDRLRVASGPAAPPPGRSGAVEAVRGPAVVQPARIRHFPQAERVNERELRKPEVSSAEHLHGLLRQVEPGIGESVRMMAPAVGRVLEALGQCDFQRQVEPAGGSRSPIAHTAQPSLEFLARLGAKLPDRSDQQRRQPRAKHAALPGMGVRLAVWPCGSGPQAVGRFIRRLVQHLEGVVAPGPDFLRDGQPDRIRRLEGADFQ